MQSCSLGIIGIFRDNSHPDVLQNIKRQSGLCEGYTITLFYHGHKCSRRASMALRFYPHPPRYIIHNTYNTPIPYKLSNRLLSGSRRNAVRPHDHLYAWDRPLCQLRATSFTARTRVRIMSYSHAPGTSPSFLPRVSGTATMKPGAQQEAIRIKIRAA
ncbi:hypothetical protein R5R35_002796 [Gryllus longicercus]|uniref:Uncharacterized protein n=1 Tax=Gryllus longicercus TaxID=2509291 RepID=A0AAN9V6M1_9ORTH